MKDITTEEAIKFLKNIVKQNGDLDSSTSVPFYKKEAKAIEKVLNELKNKDKIIDAMAQIIEDCRQNDCLESEDIDLSQIAGVKAIKQYFEKEVKDNEC
jgi:hypothetical protein